MKYITLPYKTADDINKAIARVGWLRNRYNHVSVVNANALIIIIEYSK